MGVSSLSAYVSLYISNIYTRHYNIQMVKIVPLLECRTCTEIKRTVACFNEPCDWRMCTDCHVRWFEDHDTCPACTLTRPASRRIAPLLVHTVALIAIWALFWLVGRAVMLVLGVGPNKYFCKSTDFVQLSTLGGAIILMSAVFILFSALIIWQMYILVDRLARMCVDSWVFR
jgi:hypothetical protein